MSEDDINVNERLIDEVRSRRPLWDNSTKLYSDRNMKQNLWLEVAHNLKMTDQFVKTRWKSLRDRYMKVVREEKGRSGQAAKTKKAEWPLKSYLDFLVDTVTPRNTTESYISPASEASTQSESSDGLDFVVEYVDSPTETTSTTSASSSSSTMFSLPMTVAARPSPSPSPNSSVSSPPAAYISPPPPKRSKKDKDALIDEAVLQFLSRTTKESQSQSPSQSQPTLTAEDHFYMSIARDAQGLSALRRLQLRQVVSTKLLELLTEEQQNK